MGHLRRPHSPLRFSRPHKSTVHVGLEQTTVWGKKMAGIKESGDKKPLPHIPSQYSHLWLVSPKVIRSDTQILPSQKWQIYFLWSIPPFGSIWKFPTWHWLRQFTQLVAMFLLHGRHCTQELRHKGVRHSLPSEISPLMRRQKIKRAITREWPGLWGKRIQDE